MSNFDCITKESIAKLSPCKDRFENFVNHYPDFKGDLKEFILLDKISYKDKIWVFTQLASKEQNVKWALACASSVLNIFESKYPDDKRSRKALEACEAWLKNPNFETADAAANAAANAAAAAANAAYAAYAAYSAASAAYSAYSAAYAAYSATRAAYAAYSATRAAADAYAAYSAAADDEQKEVNLLFMLEAIK